MSRSGINKALVQKAREALLARSTHPSIDAVRIELGNTGSKSTIQRYLKELSEQTSAVERLSLEAELQALIAPLAERLREGAQMEIATQREAFALEQQEYQVQRRYQQERLHQLRSSNAQLTEQLQEQRQLEFQLQQGLHHSEMERQRLLESEHGLQQLLNERAMQLQSLEEKHRHARVALEHYREQQQKQRTQDIQRHDAHIRQLQLEMRALQDTLLAKQGELETLHRDNERLLTESRTAANRNYELERGTTALKQRLEEISQTHECELANLTSALSSSHTENAKLNERWKRHFSGFRQCRRELHEQRMQFKILQTALKNLNTQRAELATAIGSVTNSTELIAKTDSDSNSPTYRNGD